MYNTVVWDKEKVPSALVVWVLLLYNLHFVADGWNMF